MYGSFSVTRWRRPGHRQRRQSVLHTLINLNTQQQLLGFGPGDKLQDEGHVYVGGSLAQQKGHAVAVLVRGVFDEAAQDIIGEVIQFQVLLHLYHPSGDL